MITTAKVGQLVTAKAAAHIRENFPNIGKILVTRESTTVQPKSDTKQGQWCCIDCGEMFANNMQAQSHMKSHRLAWWTTDHFEEP